MNLSNNTATNAINDSPIFGPLYRGLQKGTVPHEQIAALAKEYHEADFSAMLRDWMQGTLFKSQKGSFDQWMDMDEIDHRIELTQPEKYLAYELGCDEKKNEDIHNFIYRRIFKYGLGWRKDTGSNSGKREVCRGFWRKENIKYKWEWRND